MTHLASDAGTSVAPSPYQVPRALAQEFIRQMELFGTPRASRVKSYDSAVDSKELSTEGVAASRGVRDVGRRIRLALGIASDGPINFTVRQTATGVVSTTVSVAGVADRTLPVPLLDAVLSLANHQYNAAVAVCAHSDSPDEARQFLETLGLTHTVRKVEQ